jgi:hypothetical protein
VSIILEAKDWVEDGASSLLSDAVGYGTAVGSSLKACGHTLTLCLQISSYKTQ